jgi:RHS repeat-associated protein
MQIYKGRPQFNIQDRIIRQGGVTYQFNADGQLTQRGSDTFQYSSTGELLQATISGQTITYSYDGMRRWVAKTDSTGAWQYLYGNIKNPFQLTAMREPAGVLSYYYYDDNGMLFAFDKGGTRYYVATDQVGTPKVITDATGTVVKQMEFDSFGMWTVDSKPEFDMPVGFAGGIVDTRTTLVRFGYRDYEPGTGRWTAKDPIFFAGGQGNLFGYVQNNPINLTDPEGKFPVLPAIIAGGAVAAGGWYLYNHNETFRGVVDSILGNTVPDSGIGTVGTVLLNPDPPRSVLKAAVDRFNKEQAMNFENYSTLDISQYENDYPGALNAYNTAKKNRGCK